MAGILHDDWKLHNLCKDGKIKKVQEYVNKLDKAALDSKLANHKGVFGYTPLHEATANGHAAVLSYLLEKGADVNCRANSGYTPLHLAASSGHVECVRVLLNHNADIAITDEFGKSPKQTAELSSKASIVRILRSEEIIKEVEKNGEGLNELLRDNPDLEPDCLSRALLAAVRKDNHSNIGKLIIKGAPNLEVALSVAKAEGKHCARAILLLVLAAITNDRVLVLRLFGEQVANVRNTDTSDSAFVEVQKAVVSGKISTVVPIEMARRKQHKSVREELLLRTDVNQEEGTVFWHGLRLFDLELSWLRKIQWVKKLRLARNGFRTLPSELHLVLVQVVKLDLQYNDLATIPACVLTLPSLTDLNLSNNKLTSLPVVTEWSCALTILDLSHNKLDTIPGEPIATGLRTLNLSANDFQVVPLCICNFVTLRNLDLSDNKNILSLPAQMGKLKELTVLNLKNLSELNDPPKNIQKETSDCMRYLKNKLQSAKGYYRMKLMLVGKQNRGKTTLVARLQGRECGNVSTVGVDVSEWEYKQGLGKKFYFSIWDFGGQEEYYATHQCFLSERSLYLALFNLKDGIGGVEELTPWLNNIALRAPKSCVLIVGTHLDEIPYNEREEKADLVLHRAGEVANKFGNKLQIKQVLAVGLGDRLEGIGALKDAIYQSAADYKVGNESVMGQKIPASYHQLDKCVQDIQKEIRGGSREPIMHKEEYRTVIHQLKLSDIDDEDELKTATLFLNNVGTLLHYDDRSHNLDELYFVDPRWLCDMMAKIVTIRERNPYVVDGILAIKNIPILFHDDRFPWRYFEQYLTLLDRFEIALALDRERILIPSMLSEKRPDVVDNDLLNGGPFYIRRVVFNSPATPPGFWSRLISRIMHTVSQVIYALKLPAESLGITTNDDAKPPTECATDENTKQASTSTNISKQDVFALHQLTLGEESFRAACPEGFPLGYDRSKVTLHYWRTGLHYKDPELLFSIESLSLCPRMSSQKDGVVITASSSSIGKSIVGKLVDLIVTLVSDWYPGMQQDKKHLEQAVMCCECMKLGYPSPYQFDVQKCLALIVENKTSIQCAYNGTDPSKNHEVPLAEVVPDLLLQDIKPEFLLSVTDLDYEEEGNSVLGIGGFGKVYRGRCKNKSVAIKKYLNGDEALTELRKEAILLQQSHHPCLVCLVGVCVHPTLALVLEEAPLGSLEKPLLKTKQPIHRVVIHRIAVQVAAALKFLHNSGIIFRDLKAANVLLWSLDPESLCHCKVTDFGIATHLAPIGARGLIGTKGFIAPEVLHVGKRKEHSVYDHKADVFSFGMLLYQMISRTHPFSDMHPVKIDSAVESGERPKLLGVPQAEAAYFYLTRLMQRCWQGDPRLRPTTTDITNKLSHWTFQSVMSVQPVRSKLSLRHACGISSADFVEASVAHQENELWVCCDNADGIEINIFAINTMEKKTKNFIKDNQMQCICLCGDHVWIASRAGIEYGVIDIFSINNNKELVHNIRLKDNSVSCITYSNQTVYCGTLEGFCFSFARDIQQIQANVKPRYKYISENAVDGILVTKDCLWLSSVYHIFFLNLETLAIEGSLVRDKRQDEFVGQMKLSSDGSIIWSSYFGGTCVTAWNAIQKSHKFDLDIRFHMKSIEHSGEKDIVVTAFTPVLDTVWVGLAGGHILVFLDQLLMWFHPYNEYVRFLVCMPCEGPCHTEKAIVVSGGKGFNPPLVPDLPDYEKTDEKGVPVDKAGTLIIWEAFPSKMCQQMTLIQSRCSSYLDSHATVKQMIRDGGFKDGTYVIDDTIPVVPAFEKANDETIPESPAYAVSESPTTSVGATMGRRKDGFETETFANPVPTLEPLSEEGVDTSDYTPVKIAQYTDLESLTFTLQDGSIQTVTCSKPVQFSVLLSEIIADTDIAEEGLVIGYYPHADEKCVLLSTQSDLDSYLQLDTRPPLVLNTQT